MSIFSAIASGNVDAVEALLKENNARASERDENGVSAIMFALYVRERDIARRLAEVKRSLDVFEASSLGDTTAARRDPRAGPARRRRLEPRRLHAAPLRGVPRRRLDGDDADRRRGRRLRRLAERDAGAAAPQRRGRVQPRGGARARRARSGRERGAAGRLSPARRREPEPRRADAGAPRRARRPRVAASYERRVATRSLLPSGSSKSHSRPARPSSSTGTPNSFETASMSSR